MSRSYGARHFVQFLCLVLSGYLLYRLGVTSRYDLKTTSPANNLRDIDYSAVLSYPAIDVVYTWVNGSDPIWKAKKLHWGKQMGKVNLTLNGGNSTNETDVEDDTISQNRYRDSNELKYSLRSLEKYAPWIRRIYIVTDNQIPSWLDLSDEKISVISHIDIFPNRSHLPVFSSPAIETHLHRIPGLSKKFIYFNDDVFLGAPVIPEDFFSLSNSQRLRFAWDVPKCAPGCSDSWIGDGFCDKACNVSACTFDFPDCINGSNVRDKGINEKKMPASSAVCTVGCPNNWLGDRVCDVRCDSVECGWDVGDCGYSRVVASFPGTTIRPGILPSETRSVANMNSSMALSQAPVVLVIPEYKSKGFYMNLSQAFDFGTEKDIEFTEVTYTELVDTMDALYEFPTDKVVHFAALTKKTGFLTVLFFHGQDDAPSVPILPVDLYFSVTAKCTNCQNNSTISSPLSDDNDIAKRVSFRVRLVNDATAEYAHRLQPHGMVPIGSLIANHPCNTDKGSYTDTELSSVADSEDFVSHTVQILQHPFSSAYSDFLQDREYEGSDLQAVVVDLSVPPKSSLIGVKLSEIFLKAKFTTVNGTVFEYERPICRSLAHYLDSGIMDMFRDLDCEALSVRDTPAGINLAVNPKKSDLFPSSASMEFTTLPEAEYSLVDYYAVLTSTALRTVINPYRRNSDADFRFLLLVPIPPKWSDFEPSWMSATFDLIHKAPRSDSFPDSHKLLICFSSAIGWGGKNDSVVNATAADADIDRPFSSAVDDREQEFMTELAQGGLRQRRLFRADGSIKIDEDVDVSTARKLFSSALDFESLAIEENHRRLEDTYAASLLNVNRLLNKEFGHENRKVPAHMPHLIDVDIMYEMQARWESLWNATSSHRFRSPQDMQYAFAYYHYLMNRYAAHPLNPAAFLADEIDTNGDGLVDDNEFRTLAAIVNAKILTPEKIKSFKECAFPVVREERSVRQAEEGEVEEHLIIKAPRTIQSIMNCSIIVTAIVDRFKSARFPLAPPTYTLGSEDDVAFEMIHDNVTLTIEKLDSVRWRKCKFICLNDNVKAYTSELEVAVKDFFVAMYPTPSRFELPLGTSNPTLYLDEYRVLFAAKHQNKYSFLDFSGYFDSLNSHIDYSLVEFRKFISLSFELFLPRHSRLLIPLLIFAVVALICMWFFGGNTGKNVLTSPLSQANTLEDISKKEKKY